jgi:hypothetical protein
MDTLILSLLVVVSIVIDIGIINWFSQ